MLRLDLIILSRIFVFWAAFVPNIGITTSKKVGDGDRNRSVKV